nr:hypothetical protein [Tanacetum cinerariifolium]
CNVEQERTQSDDPFSIYDLLKKKKGNTESDSDSDNNLKFLPGFTPLFNAEEKSNDMKERTQSDDPFSIYDLLKKKKGNTKSDSDSDNNLKFPPGFTPLFNAEEKKKQMDAKLAWLLEKYYYRSQESVGCSSSQADLYLTDKELHQHLDEEALRETLEEKAMDEKARDEKIRQKQADDEFFLEFGVVRYDSEYESSN